MYKIYFYLGQILKIVRRKKEWKKGGKNEQEGKREGKKRGSNLLARARNLVLFSRGEWYI